MKSRNSDAIAIEIGLFAGTKTSTEATYSPKAITNANSVPANAPGHTNGWRYPFGFAWFTEELKGPSGASFVKLQSFPVVAGIGYGWHFGKLSTGVQMQAGWAFNSGKAIGDMGAAFGAPGFPVAVDIGDSFVVRPQAKVEYFLTPKFTVRSSLNYVMAHPMVTLTTPQGTTSKRWDASNVTLSVGIGVYPFRK